MSSLDELCLSYRDLLGHFDPASATEAGSLDARGRLGNYDDGSVREHIAALRAIAGAIEDLDIYDAGDEIDRTALLDEIRVRVFRFEDEQPHRRNPEFWVTHLCRSLDGLMAQPDVDPLGHTEAALQRMQAIPAYLASARETLKAPPLIALDTALDLIEHAARLVALTAATFADAPGAEPSDLLAAAGEAEGSLARLRLALHSEIAPAPDPLAFAIGEDAFNRRLHYEFALPHSAPEAWRYGMHLADEAEAAIRVLADEIEPGQPWREVYDRLDTQGWPGPATPEAWRDEIVRAREVVERTGLVAVPAVEVAVRGAPGFLSALRPFPGYFPPGGRAIGTIFLPRSHSGGGADYPGWPEGDGSAWRLPAAVAHLAYPGRHLQAVSASALPRIVRSYIACPMTTLGWGLYAEDLAVESGALASPEHRMAGRVSLLWNAMRLLIDVGLHTRQMTPDAAVDLLLNRLPIDHQTAMCEVRWACTRPALQSAAALGRREILRLRETWRARSGEGATLRKFHDEFFSYGTLPVSLIEWGMGLDA